LSEVTIGIIGVGRIGTSVLSHLKGFGRPKILVDDINPNINLNQDFNIEWVDKEEIYKKSDIITLHTPLTSLTKNMIKKEQLLMIKSDAVIINTARGGGLSISKIFMR